VIALHHVNVVVPAGRTEDVVGFYVLLGLTRVAKPTEGVAQTGAWFDFPGGQTQVHVSEREGAVHPEQHFAVRVADLDAVVAALRSAGHPVEPAPELFGARRVNTADPAGNKVELMEAAT
jgi:catechol 2,3-dioxygenase-like lactoylglutathione lyase family enzyme